MDDYGSMSKNDIDVKFPVYDHDLTEFWEGKEVDEKYMYDLFAVSNHFGGLGGGHYTAFSKSIGKDSWFRFDDDHVTAIHDPT